jgi:hypothetical protein
LPINQAKTLPRITRITRKQQCDIETQRIREKQHMRSETRPM